LRWWYDNAKPTEDPTLALIAEIWDRDRTLDNYLAWSLTNRPEIHAANLPSYPSRISPLPPHWAQWMIDHARIQAGRTQLPYHFGPTGDTFHLDAHLQSTQPSVDATIGVMGHKRAVMTTSDATNWYVTLVELGRTLEPLHKQSWHVDVYVRPIGFMGTFRQSRSSGRWFSGRHQFHSPGTA
jgi:hypothetical protein